MSPSSSPDPRSLRAWVGRRLLAWFGHAQRALPWRANRDPYRIWVSEVMLQQTQVATVIPYFERFLVRFPALADLAAASEQEVLRLWEGLGYYRRARALHAAARRLCERHEGRLPVDAAALGELPGMGRYTVNAVLSQAFDQRLPILEANSVRVWCRFFGKRENPSRGPLRAWLWQAAEQILPVRQVGAFNQAVMELGALVCTSSAPGCKECPLRSKCQAHQLDLQDAIPFRTPPLRSVDVREFAVVLRKGSRVFLVQRPPSGRWENLWEFPHAELANGESPEQANRILWELTGMKGTLGAEIMTIRHAVTRWNIEMVCFEAHWKQGAFHSSFYSNGRWVKLADLINYPVSSPQRRLIRALTQFDNKEQPFSPFQRASSRSRRTAD